MSIDLNDPSFLPIVTTEENASDNNIFDTTDESVNQDVPMDTMNEMVSEQIEGGENVTDQNTSDEVAEEQVKEVQPPSRPASKGDESVSENIPEASTQERQSESPTTREGYVFKCIFCESVLTAQDGPKLLECLHNACSNCVNNKLYEQNDGSGLKSRVDCPLCTLSSLSERVLDNQFLLELSSNDEQTSKITDLKCSSCTDDAIATSYCTDCSEFICENCVQAHQRVKITKDHTIKPKEECANELNAISNVTPTLFCSKHPSEKLSLFCENCDQLTCRDCQLIKHREHKYKFTHEIASDARKHIAEMLKDVGYKRALLTSAMKVIDDRQNQITDKKQSLVKEITQLVVRLTNAINIRGKQLVAKLSEVCDSKQATLQEKKQALELLSKMTDNCIEFTQHALTHGSDMALLYSKKQVTDHLKRIKCKRADIPNPEIPVRIHLALDEAKDVVKVVSSLGQIVVDGRVFTSHPPQGGVVVQPGQLPPHGSPSPGQSRPPQQQSPIASGLHQPPTLPQQQSSPSGFVQPRYNAPPPYSQMQNNQGLHVQNLHMGQNAGGGVSAPNQTMLSPNFNGNMSLAQQLNLNRMQQRPPAPMQRAIMPRLPGQNLQGLNHQQQQQVSSSTHPQRLIQDQSNLRHLLQPNGNPNNPVYIQTGPAQYQAVQQQYNRFTAQQPQQQQQQQQPQPQIQFRSQNPQLLNQMQRMMMAGNRMPAPNRMNFVQQQSHLHPQQQQQQQQSLLARSAAKWHTPQQNIGFPQQQQQQQQQPNCSTNNRNMTLPTLNDNFKITLRHQNQPDQKNLPSTVSSTIPKTPSPNHVQGKSDTERHLDKYCEDSVKDLMATIAKLDSNGVQVLAEGRHKGGSPQVDSSTGDGGLAAKIKSEINDAGKDDPNEDWCAVCMDGGELVCCDKCPKVFHQYCHIPNLSVEETDTWQCLLCMNFADLPDNFMGEKHDGELSAKERKIAERLVLELYCQYDASLPFREIIGPENIDYHSVIKHPIALDTIRQKLNWDSENHYRTLDDLIKDVRLMFRNAYCYNSVDSLVYKDAKTLEKFFDEQLEKFLPLYAYDHYNDDEMQQIGRAHV